MDKTTPGTDLKNLHGYFLAFGSVGHYLKRASEFHASRETPEPLPPRWLHLAERSLIRAEYPKYLEFAQTPAEAGWSDDAKTRLARLNRVADQINALVLRPDILSAFRQKGSLELQELSGLYQELHQAAYGADAGT